MSWKRENVHLSSNIINEEESFTGTKISSCMLIVQVQLDFLYN